MYKVIYTRTVNILIQLIYYYSSFTSSSRYEILLLSNNGRLNEHFLLLSMAVQHYIKLDLFLISCTFLPGWFGIRKDFCHFLLSLCPFLQEYANIAYSLQSDEAARRGQSVPEGMVDAAALDMKSDKRFKKTELSKPVVPVISIDMPD
jgi:hypothetical protein